MTDALRIRALFGDDRKHSDTPRGRVLRSCRDIRATMAWIRPGAYAYWRYVDYLKAAQRKLAELRQTRN